MAKKKRPPRKNTGNKGDVGRRAAQLAQDPDAIAAAEAEYRGDIDRSRLPESIRRLGEDEQFPVIITTGGDEPPEGAGELLGELNQDLATAEGFPLPEGSKVWQDTRPGTMAGRAAQAGGDRIIVPEGMGGLVRPPRAVDGLRLPAEMARRGRETTEIKAATSPLPATRQRRKAPPPAAFVRDPAAYARSAGTFARALEDQQPGLTGRLARGLSPEELADPGTLRAIAGAASGSGPGRYQVVQGGAAEPMPAKVITGGSRTDGGEGLPGGLQPGDIIAAARPAGYQAAGVPLPEGYAGDPGDRVWRPLAGPGLELTVTNDLDAVDTANTDLVIEDLDADDENDSGRVLLGSPAAVRAYHARAEAADKRAARLIPGAADTLALARTREAADAVGLRENWTAAQVLAAHEWLNKHYQAPPDEIADYLAFHIRNSLAQDHKTAEMFWPVDLTRGADIAEGTEMARLIARGLDSARTIQVAPQMCRAMRAGWDAEPDQVLMLDEGLLPVPAGFAWLDAPWLMELSAGYWLPVRAVSWERTVIFGASRKGLYGITPGGTGITDAVRIVLWLRIPDDVAFGRWKGHERRALKVANQVGNLVPMQIGLLPFGVRVRTEGEFRTNGKSLLGLLHTLWKTLGEKIPKSRPVRAALPGGPRQAARRTLRHDDVHVITLREYSYDSDPAPHHPQDVQWTCRWWVSEFYRHIDHYEDGTDEKGRNRRHQAIPAKQPGLLPDDDHDICAVCLANGQTVRISYVAGFDKGPPGLPFRTPAGKREVYRLAR